VRLVGSCYTKVQGHRSVYLHLVLKLLRQQLIFYR